MIFNSPVQMFNGDLIEVTLTIQALVAGGQFVTNVNSSQNRFWVGCQSHYWIFQSFGSMENIGRLNIRFINTACPGKFTCIYRLPHALNYGYFMENRSQ